MKKRLQGFITGIIVAGILLSAIPSFAAGISKKISVILNGICIKYNDKSLKTDTITYNGRYYAPVKDIAEACGKVIVSDAKGNINIKDKVIAITPTPKPTPAPTPTPILNNQNTNSFIDSNDTTIFPQKMEVTDFLFKSKFQITINKVEQDDESLRLYVNYTYLDGLIDYDFYDFFSVVVSYNGKTYSSIDWGRYKTKISRPGEMKVKDSTDGIIYFSPIYNVDKIDIKISDRNSNPDKIYSSIKNINVKSNEIINPEAEPLNAPLLKSKDELKKYLEAVFCKYFLPKVANHFSIVLQLEFPQCCKPHFPHRWSCKN